MADATVSSSITLLQTILTFSGALLAPIIGTAASLISRSPLQRRQQAIEYRVKQLELFDKAVSVGKSLSEALGKPFDGSIIEAEYYKLIRQLPEQPPPSAEEFPATSAAEFTGAVILAAASADNLGMDRFQPCFTSMRVMFVVSASEHRPILHDFAGCSRAIWGRRTSRCSSISTRSCRC